MNEKRQITVETFDVFDHEGIDELIEALTKFKERNALCEFDYNICAGYYDDPATGSIEASRLETDEELAARIRKDEEYRSMERQKRLAQYLALKNEFGA